MKAINDREIADLKLQQHSDACRRTYERKVQPIGCIVPQHPLRGMGFLGLRLEKNRHKQYWRLRAQMCILENDPNNLPSIIPCSSEERVP